MAAKTRRMFRSISLFCGFAVGSTITVKSLNLLNFHDNSLKASVQPRSLENSELKLVLVQVLFRHGSRTPLKIIPRIEETIWDKNRLLYELPHTKLRYTVKDLKNRVLPDEEGLTENLLRGGCRMGQLTVVGQQETYDLGKSLKNLYNDQLNFIGGTFDPKTTFLRTTHIPRTIDSLKCLVAGMFEHINEPVTFWTIPVKEEFLMPNWSNCNVLRQYMKYCFKHAHKLRGYQEDLEKFFDVIGGHVPQLTFVDIYDDLSCRKAHNKPYPEKIKHFMETVEKHMLQFFTEVFLSPPSWTNKLILPLSTGQLLKHLFDNMKKKVANTSPYKCYLYSVHDTSIISLLCTLGYPVEKWPHFASYVALELYKNKNEEYFVKILYCGKVVKLKGFNQTLIPLAQFEKVTSPYFINDRATACQTVLSPPEC